MRKVFLSACLITIGQLMYGQDSSVIAAPIRQNKRTDNYQTITPIKKADILGLLAIEVSYDMTTHIIFPYDIIYVDLGSADVVSQKSEKVTNVLKVKANKRGFSPTNITVITADGQYFSFIASYAEFPKTLNINLHSGDKVIATPPPNLPNNMDEGVALIGDVKMDEGQLNKYSNWIIKKKRRLHHIGEDKYHMTAAVDNIYVKNNVLFISCSLQNDSEVDYDINFIKFYIRDAKTMKRSAQQELEVTPIYTFDPQKAIAVAGKSLIRKIFCFQRFTIYDNKNFAIEMLEKNGGRKFSFNLSNEDIIRAKKIRI